MTTGAPATTLPHVHSEAATNTGTTPLAPDSVFGRYVIRRELGSGAFGAVYEATQQPLGKRVALKILHATQLHNMEALRRFTTEAEATAKLSHPHIVDVLDLGAHEGVPYIAMEFLDGESLHQRLVREKCLPPRAAIDLLLPVISAVAMVHDAGIVHRDLKPENLFLAAVRPGKVHAKVLDFGIAKITDGSNALTRTGSMMGTAYYMSPEQARESKDVDARSDVWALGVIVYECVTGRLPFPGDAMIDVLTGIISAPVPSMAEVAELPPGLETVLHRSMEKRREDRFSSVRTMGAALLPFASPAVRDEWSAEFEKHAEAMEDALSAAKTMDSRPSAAPNTGVVAPTLIQSVSFTPKEIPSELRSRGGGRSKTSVAIAATVALAGIAGVVALASRTGTSRPDVSAHVVQVPTPFVVALETEPATARIEIDGELAGVGHASRSLARDGSEHRLRVSANGYQSAELTFSDSRRPPERVVLMAVPQQVVAAVTASAAAAPRPRVAPRVVPAVRRPVPPVARPTSAVATEPGAGQTSAGIEIH